MSDAMDLYVATRLAFLDRPEVRLCTRPLFNRGAVTIYAIDDAPAGRTIGSATVSELELAMSIGSGVVDAVAGELRQRFA